MNDPNSSFNLINLIVTTIKEENKGAENASLISDCCYSFSSTKFKKSIQVPQFRILVKKIFTDYFEEFCREESKALKSNEEFFEVLEQFID